MRELGCEVMEGVRVRLTLGDDGLLRAWISEEECVVGQTLVALRRELRWRQQEAAQRTRARANLTVVK